MITYTNLLDTNTQHDRDRTLSIIKLIKETLSQQVGHFTIEIIIVTDEDLCNPKSHIVNHNNVAMIKPSN